MRTPSGRQLTRFLYFNAKSQLFFSLSPSSFYDVTFAQCHKDDTSPGEEQLVSFPSLTTGSLINQRQTVLWVI